MYASLCVTILSNHALFSFCWAWKQGGCQSERQRVGLETEKDVSACLRA